MTHSSINLKEFEWNTDVKSRTCKNEKGVKMSTITVIVMDKTNKKAEKLIYESFYKQEEIKLIEERMILILIEKLHKKR
jgi:hypothetical protein